jgi:hypothetical protein
MSQRKYYYDDSVPKVELVESDEEVAPDRDLLSRGSEKTVNITSPRQRKEFVKVNLRSNENKIEDYPSKSHARGSNRLAQGGTKPPSQKKEKEDTSKLLSPTQNRNMHLAHANFVTELSSTAFVQWMQIPDKYVVNLDGTAVNMHQEQSTSEQKENTQHVAEVDQFINEQN